MIMFPPLKRVEKSKECDQYKTFEKDELVYQFLFRGRSHKWLDDNVLYQDPSETLGLHSKNILHHLGLGEEHRHIFKSISVKKAKKILSDVNGSEHIIEALDRHGLSRNGDHGMYRAAHVVGQTHARELRRRKTVPLWVYALIPIVMGALFIGHHYYVDYIVHTYSCEVITNEQDLPDNITKAIDRLEMERGCYWMLYGGRTMYLVVCGGEEYYENYNITIQNIEVCWNDRDEGTTTYISPNFHISISEDSNSARTTYSKGYKLPFTIIKVKLASYSGSHYEILFGKYHSVSVVQDDGTTEVIPAFKAFAPYGG